MKTHALGSHDAPPLLLLLDALDAPELLLEELLLVVVVVPLLEELLLVVVVPLLLEELLLVVVVPLLVLLAALPPLPLFPWSEGDDDDAQPVSAAARATRTVQLRSRVSARAMGMPP